MKAYVTIVILLSALLISCSKDDENGEDDPNTIPSAEYFIEGKIDGEMVRAEYVCEYAGCEFSAANYNNSLNWITMQRIVSSTDFRGFDIHIMYVDLDNWVVPDTLDASSLFNQENLDLSYYSGHWESKNNFLVDGVVMGDDSFQFIVSSKTNDIIEGTFSGELRNGSDSNERVTISEGKFRILIYRI